MINTNEILTGATELVHRCKILPQRRLHCSFFPRKRDWSAYGVLLCAIIVILRLANLQLLNMGIF